MEEASFGEALGTVVTPLTADVTAAPTGEFYVGSAPLRPSFTSFEFHHTPTSPFANGFELDDETWAYAQWGHGHAYAQVSSCGASTQYSEYLQLE